MPGSHRLDVGGSAAVQSNPTASARSSLGDERHVGGVEDGGILERLVLALGDGEHARSAASSPRSYDAGHTRLPTFSTNSKSSSSSAQPSSARWTIAASRWQTVPVVICRTRRAAARQPGRVVLGGQIADQRRHADAAASSSVSVRSSSAVLPGARARHQAHDEDAGLAEALPQLAGDDVVLLEDVLPDFDQARLAAHVSISRATSSSSRPCRISGVGVPHSAQQNAWTLLERPPALAARDRTRRRAPPR